MNWEAISAVAESLGTFSVLATLIYLAVQVKDAKSSTADSNRIERAVGVREGLMALAQNDELRKSFDNASELSGLYEKMAEEFSITAEDAARSHYYVIYWFWLHWGQYASTKEDRDLSELSALIRELYSHPLYYYWWKHSPWCASMIEGGFVEFVDNILSEQVSKS